MFEQGLSFILKRVIRDFIEDGENLNDKIQVGVWSGLIILENLVLKTSALAMMNSPITLNYGYIGRLEIRIPWASLGTEPVSIVLDKIYVLIEPKYEWNPHAAERREQAMKQAKLAAAEIFAHERLSSNNNNNNTSSFSNKYTDLAKNWLLSAFLSKIINNFQITIREIHIRYEDKLSCPSNFCIGFSFESLLLQTREPSNHHNHHEDRVSPLRTTTSNMMMSSSNIIDRNYDKELKISGNDAFYKLIELNHLAIYWNPLVNKGLDICSCSFIGRSPKEIHALMSRTIVSRICKIYDRPRHHYILHPMDVTVHLDMSVNLTTQNIKSKVKVFIPNLSISLEDRQLREIISMALNMANFSKLEKFSYYRPKKSIKECPKEWWNYAIQAVLIQLRIDRHKEKGLNFKKFTQRLEDKFVYLELWKARLVSSSKILQQLNQNNPFLNADISSSASDSGATEKPRLDRRNHQLYQRLLRMARRAVLERKFRENDIDFSPEIDLTKVDARTIQPLDSEKIALLQLLEYELSFEDIIYFRSLAERNVSFETRKENWLGNVYSWITTGSSSSYSGKTASEEERRTLFDALKYDPEQLFRAGASEVDSNEIQTIVDVFIKEGAVTLALSPPESQATFQPSIPFLEVRIFELRTKNIIMGDGSHVRVYVSLQDLEGYTVTPSVRSSSAPASSFPSAATAPNTPLSTSSSSPPQVHYSSGKTRVLGIQHEFVYRKFLFRRNLKVNSDLKNAETESSISFSEDNRSTFSFSSKLRGLVGSTAGTTTGVGGSVVNNTTPPIFWSMIELSPENKEIEVAVYLELEELELWFSPKSKAMDQLVIFSLWPEDLQYWSEMEMHALNQLGDLKTRVNAKLEYMLNNHSNVLIEGRINAPVVIVYDTESKLNTEKSNVLVLDLGLMKIHTEKLAKAKRQRDLEAQSIYSLTNASGILMTPPPTNRKKTGSGDFNEKSSPDGRASINNGDQQDHDDLLLDVVQDPIPLVDHTDENPLMQNSLMRRSSIFHKYDTNGGEGGGRNDSNYHQQELNRSFELNTTTFTQRGELPGDFDFTEEELFDVFQLQISSIEVYLIEATITNDIDTGKWSVAYDTEKTIIIPNFDIEIEIQVSVLPWDITLPPVKLFIDIPDLQVQLSEAKILRLVQFANELVQESTILIESNMKKIKKVNDAFRKKELKKLATSNLKSAMKKSSLSTTEKSSGGVGSSARFSRRRSKSMGGESVSSRRVGSEMEFFDAQSNAAGDERMTQDSSVRPLSTRRKRSNRYSKSSAFSETTSITAEARARLKKLDEAGIQISSDDGKGGAGPEENDDADDDDSFFSIDDQQDPQVHEKAIEELKYVIAQRESMRAKLITDIRLTEGDITKSSLHENLKQELTTCELDLHQLKVSYVELLMNHQEYLQAFDQSELDGFDDELRIKQHIENMISSDTPSNRGTPSHEFKDDEEIIGHKRDLVHASIFKLPDIDTQFKERDNKLIIDSGPSKELVYVKVMITSINVDLQYKESGVSKAVMEMFERSSNARGQTSPRPAGASGGSQSGYDEVYRLNLTGINLKLRHRSNDTSISFHLRDVHYLDVKIPSSAFLANGGNPITLNPFLPNNSNNERNVIPFITTDPSFYALFATPIYSTRSSLNNYNSQGNTHEFIRMRHEIRYEHYLDKKNSTEIIDFDNINEEEVRKVAIHNVKLNLGYLAINFDQKKVKSLITFMTSLQGKIEKMMPMNKSMISSGHSDQSKVSAVSAPLALVPPAVTTLPGAAAASAPPRIIPPMTIIEEPAYHSDNESDSNNQDSKSEHHPMKPVYDNFNDLPMIVASVKFDTFAFSLLSDTTPIVNLTVSAINTNVKLAPNKVNVGFNIADVSAFNLLPSNVPTSRGNGGRDYNNRDARMNNYSFATEYHGLPSKRMIFGRHVEDNSPFLISQLTAQSQRASEVINVNHQSTIAYLASTIDEGLILELVREIDRIQENFSSLLNTGNKDKVVIAPDTSTSQLTAESKGEVTSQKEINQTLFLVLSQIRGRIRSDCNGFQISYPIYSCRGDPNSAISEVLQFKIFNMTNDATIGILPVGEDTLNSNPGIQLTTKISSLRAAFNYVSLFEPADITNTVHLQLQERVLTTSHSSFDEMSSIPTANLRAMSGSSAEDRIILSQPYYQLKVDVNGIIQPIVLHLNQSNLQLFKEIQTNIDYFSRTIQQILAKHFPQENIKPNPYDITIASEKRLTLLPPLDLMVVNIKSTIEEVSVILEGDSYGCMIARLNELVFQAKVSSSSLPSSSVGEEKNPLDLPITAQFLINSFTLEDVDPQDNTYYIINAGKFPEGSPLNDTYGPQSAFLDSLITISADSEIKHTLFINDVQIAYHPTAVLHAIDIIQALQYPLLEDEANPTLTGSFYASMTSPRPDSPKPASRVNSTVHLKTRQGVYTQAEEHAPHPSSIPMSTTASEQSKESSEEIELPPPPLSLLILNLLDFHLPNTVSSELNIQGLHFWIPMKAIGHTYNPPPTLNTAGIAAQPSTPPLDLESEALRISTKLSTSLRLSTIELRALLNGEPSVAKDIKWINFDIPVISFGVSIMQRFPYCTKEEKIELAPLSRIGAVSGEHTSDATSSTSEYEDAQRAAPSISSSNSSAKKYSRIATPWSTLVQLEGAFLIALQTVANPLKESVDASYRAEITNGSVLWSLVELSRLQLAHNLVIQGDFTKLDIQAFLDYRPFLDLFANSIQPVIDKVEEINRWQRLHGRIEPPTTQQNGGNGSAKISTSKAPLRIDKEDVSSISSIDQFFPVFLQLVDIHAMVTIERCTINLLNDLYQHPIPIVLVSTSNTEIKFTRYSSRAQHIFAMIESAPTVGDYASVEEKLGSPIATVSSKDYDLQALNPSAVSGKSRSSTLVNLSTKKDALFEEEMQVSVSITLNVNYQNQRLLALEPLVEPVNLSLRFNTYRPDTTLDPPKVTIMNLSPDYDYKESHIRLIQPFVQHLLPHSTDDSRKDEYEIILPPPSLALKIQKINVNVTMPFLEIVFITIKSIETLESMMLNPATRHYYPTSASASYLQTSKQLQSRKNQITLLTIRNESGLHVRYALHHHNSKVLSPGTEEPVHINSKFALNGLFDQLLSAKKLQLAIEKPSTVGEYLTIQDISLEGVGCRLVSLMNDAFGEESTHRSQSRSRPRRSAEGVSDSSPAVIIDLSSRNGIKTLIVRSTLRVFNSTQTAFYVRFTIPAVNSDSSDRRRQREVLWESFIPAGKGSFLPAQLCHLTNGFITVSPRPSQESHEESNSAIVFRGDNSTGEFFCPRFSDSSNFDNLSESENNKEGENDADPSISYEERRKSSNKAIRRKKWIQQRGTANTFTYFHWLNLRDQPVYPEESATVRLRRYFTTYACNVNVESKGKPFKKQPFTSSSMLRTVTILSPISVVSYLANDIKLVILPELDNDPLAFHSSKTSLTDLFEDKVLAESIPQYHLKSGQAAECLHIPANESFYLSIQAVEESSTSTSASCYWSPLIKIMKSSEDPQASVSSSSTATIELLYRNEARLTINVEIIDRGGCRILHFFVPYWIVPSSFLPLQYQHDNKLGASSYERNGLNGKDQFAADQYYERPSNCPTHSRGSSHQSSERVPLLSRDKPKYIGKARGVDGIIIGPEYPSKGLADVLQPFKPSGLIPAALSHKSLPKSPSQSKYVGGAFSFPHSAYSLPSESGNETKQLVAPPPNLVYTHQPPLTREISDLDMIEPYAMNRQDSFGSNAPSTVAPVGSSNATALVKTPTSLTIQSKLFAISQCSYTNSEKRNGRIRFKHQNSTWSNFISLDYNGYQYLTLESVDQTPSATSSQSNTSTINGGTAKSSSSNLSTMGGGSSNLPAGNVNSPFLKSGKKEFTFAVNVQPLEAPYQRTKAITIVDQYVVINNMGQTIEVRQAKQDNLFTIQPVDDEVPLWWRPNAPKLLQVRLARYGWSWSGKFAIEKESEIPVRLRNDYDNTVFFILIIVSKQGPKTNITFHYGGDKLSPYRFENHTIETFRIKQVGQQQYTNLLPYHCCSYAWDEPLLTQSFTISVLKNALQSQDEWVEIGNFDFNRLEDLQKMKIDHLSSKVVANGPTRVFQIFDIRLLNNNQASLPPTMTTRRQHDSSVGSGGRRFQNSKESLDGLSGGPGSTNGGGPIVKRMKKNPVNFHLSLTMELFGVSVVDPTPEELLYSSISDLTIEFSQESKRHSLDVTIQKIQIDNQLFSTPYPSLFHPLLPSQDIYNHEREQVPAPGQSALAGHKHFIHVKVVQDFEYEGLLFFPLISVQMCPFDINLEGTIIFKLIQMVSNAIELFSETVGPYSRNIQAKYMQGTTAEKVGEGSGSVNMMVKRGRNEFDIHDLLLFSAYSLGSIQYKPSMSQIQKMITMMEVLYDRYAALPQTAQRFANTSAYGSFRGRGHWTGRGGKQSQYGSQQSLSKVYIQKILQTMNYSALYPRSQHYHQQQLQQQQIHNAVHRQKLIRSNQLLKASSSTRNVPTTPHTHAAPTSYSHETPHSPFGKKLYFQQFSISEIRFNISFNPVIAQESHTAGGGTTASSYSIYQEIRQNSLFITAINSILLAIGSSIAKIENCPLRFYPYQLQHIFVSNKGFNDLLINNYAIQAVKQSYLVLFSSQILGNPVQLIQMLSEGIWDFLYMPTAGLLTSPEAFVLGVLRGSKSLVKSVIASFCTSAGHLTSSLQVGLITLGVVDGYPNTSHNHQTSVPVPTIEGTSQSTTNTAQLPGASGLLLTENANLRSSPSGEGANALVPATSTALTRKWTHPQSLRPTNVINGIKYALVGLFLDPIIGFKEDGLRGLITGSVKGSFGMIGRPLYGLLGSTSLLLDKISFTLLPRYLTNQKLRLIRIRPPRFFRHMNLPLQIYSANENIGQELLSRIADGMYRNEVYVYHCNSVSSEGTGNNNSGNGGEKDETLLLTKNYLFIVNHMIDHSLIQFQSLITKIVSIDIDYSSSTKRSSESGEVDEGDEERREREKELKQLQQDSYDQTLELLQLGQERFGKHYGSLDGVVTSSSKLFQSSLIGQPTLSFYYLPDDSTSGPLSSRGR